MKSRSCLSSLFCFLKLTGLKIWSHIGSLGGMMLPDLSLCKKILNISRPRVQEIRQPLKPPRMLGRVWGDGSTGRQRQCTLRSKPDEPLPHLTNRLTYQYDINILISISIDIIVRYWYWGQTSRVLLAVTEGWTGPWIIFGRASRCCLSNLWRHCFYLFSLFVCLFVFFPQ